MPLGSKVLTPDLYRVYTDCSIYEILNIWFQKYYDSSRERERERERQ